MLGALLVLAVAIVGVVRFAPGYIPPQVTVIFDSLRGVQLPFLRATQTSTSLPLPTETLPVTDEPVATTTGFSPTATATRVLPTHTPETVPTTQITLTPDNTPVAVATSIGGSGQIAFASGRSGLPQIFMINADGTSLVQLTNLEQGACQPSWSPDGSQLVFISPCDRRGDFFETPYKESSLYLINADGTNLKPLTTAPGSDFDPAWSPDGNRIAFTSVRDGQKEIYLLSMKSLAITRLTTATGNVESNQQPAWSPDGKLIAYTVKRVGAYQVWVMNDTGQENVQLARSGQQLWDFLPAWSPDAKTIFFSERWASTTLPWLMKVNYEDLSLDPVRLDFQTPVEDVEFSPDGFWLTFEGRDNNTGNRDIYIMTVAGSGRTRLTNDPGVDFDPAWRPMK